MPPRIPSRFRAMLPRTIQQISLEIDEELGFHIDSSIRELLDECSDTSEAIRVAHDRFGDIAQVRATLISMGMRPWKRLFATTAALSTLCLVLGGTGLVLWSGQIKEQGVVQSTLRDELGRAKVALMSVDLQDKLQPAQTVRFIRIHGAVSHPRVWTLTRTTPITLGQLIAKSGGMTPEATGRAYVILQSEQSVETMVFDLTDVQNGTVADPTLPKSCTIFVEPLGMLDTPATDKQG